MNSLGLSPVRGEAANRLNNGTAAQYVKNKKKCHISPTTSKRVWILVSRECLGSVKDKVRLNFGFHRRLLWRKPCHVELLKWPLNPIHNYVCFTWKTFVADSVPLYARASLVSFKRCGTGNVTWLLFFINQLSFSFQEQPHLWVFQHENPTNVISVGEVWSFGL
jgi:hypothetical protein